jgi:hypothetical protein
LLCTFCTRSTSSTHGPSEIEEDFTGQKQWNGGMIVFEETHPYMNNFHFPVKRDLESVIPVLPPKKTSTPLRARDYVYIIQKEDQA